MRRRSTTGSTRSPPPPPAQQVLRCCRQMWTSCARQCDHIGKSDVSIASAYSILDTWTGLSFASPDVGTPYLMLSGRQLQSLRGGAFTQPTGIVTKGDPFCCRLCAQSTYCSAAHQQLMGRVVGTSIG